MIPAYYTPADTFIMWVAFVIMPACGLTILAQAAWNYTMDKEVNGAFLGGLLLLPGFNLVVISIGAALVVVGGVGWGGMWCLDHVRDMRSRVTSKPTIAPRRPL